MNYEETKAKVAEIKAANDANTATVTEAARVTVATATAKANAEVDALWAAVDKPAAA